MARSVVRIPEIRDVLLRRTSMGSTNTDRIKNIVASASNKGVLSDVHQ
jgi:hypothetical protein